MKYIQIVNHIMYFCWENKTLELETWTWMQQSRVHFTNNFSTVIQIWWKFHSALTQIVVKWLLWNFAHGKTAVLLWRVRNSVAIWHPTMDLHYNQFSIQYELPWGICSWNSPQAKMLSYLFSNFFCGNITISSCQLSPCYYYYQK